MKAKMAEHHQHREVHIDMTPLELNRDKLRSWQTGQDAQPVGVMDIPQSKHRRSVITSIVNISDKRVCSSSIYFRGPYVILSNVWQE